jgi:hypothetical protein
LELVESRFDDETMIDPQALIVASPREPGGINMIGSLQVRDVALATAVHLRGGDLRAYFPRVRMHSVSVFNASSLAFPEMTAEREAAFERYGRAYPKEQPSGGAPASGKGS